MLCSLYSQTDRRRDRQLGQGREVRGALMIDGSLRSPISALVGIDLPRSHYVIKTIEILKRLFCEIIAFFKSAWSIFYLIGRYETFIKRYSILLFGHPALYV